MADGSRTPLKGPIWRKPIDMFASSRLGSAIFRPTLHLLDRPLMRLTGGRVAMTFGLPTLLLTTTGAKSGKARSVPLLYIPHGDDIAIIGTKFGSTSHPGWYYNLTAKPEATVLLNGETFACTARAATADERVEIWGTAVPIYPGYNKYLSRVGGREVPIFVLERRKAGD